ncbi:MAG: SDR family oxidoreductase [Bordetella sp.]|nr:SDR family oxidoreductase [Bordetella sp.]
MELGIRGRVALVCGASRGLGLACAQALVEEGVDVMLVARSAEGLEQAAAGLRAASRSPGCGAVAWTAADIATARGRRDALAAQAHYDIVVTNAGGPPPGDFRQWEREDWLAALDANMLAPIELMRATVDAMAQRGYGRVLNITSGAVKAPIQNLGLSNGARSGLTGFVAGLARSGLAAQGVTINNLLPGPFETDRLIGTMKKVAQASGQSWEDLRSERMARVPAARFGRPEELGALCAFLCSVQAAYITGQNILIDGGSFGGTL